MPTANFAEYLEIDGIPLSTAAWHTEDIATVLQGPGTRGSDILLPVRAGETPRRRILTGRTVTVPLTVNGFYDSDGDAHADPRAGLIANLNELKVVLAPNYRTLTGTRTLEWVNTDTGVTKTAEVHVSPAIQVSSLGPFTARVIVEFVLPGGVWRSASNTTHTFTVNTPTTSQVLSITNPGTGQVEDATITVTGPSGGSGAASFTIYNRDHGPTAGAVYLDYPNALSATLTINCGTFTATHGATPVGGSVLNGGTPLWLPILPGEQELEVILASNAANCTVTVSYKAVWL
jgi:hypothetical protein